MAMVTSRMSQYMPQAHTGSHFQSNNHPTSSPMLGQPSPTNSEFSEGHVGLEDIRSWDERKVGEWLRSIGWQKYDAVFEKNNITGEALLECDHSVLKELGITKIGDRIRIFVAVKALRTKAMGNAKKRNRDTLAALDNTMGPASTPRDRKRFSRTEPLPRDVYPGTPLAVNSPPNTGNTVKQSQWTPVATPGSRPNANVKDFCITVYGENGVKRTIDVRECNTPDAIMRRILAKFSKQQDNPILWSLYTITPSSSGGRDRIKALGDADLLEIVGNNTLPERSRLVLQRRGSPPSPSSREFVLARQIAIEQIERANLENNARNDKVQDITGHPSEEIRPEPRYAVNPRPRGDKLPPFFQERPPSEFISSNLAEYFPDHGHKALERTVRNSIRRSRMMSRQGTTSSRLSIATTRSFGSSISDHSIPPVPTVGNVWLRDQGAQPLTSASMTESSSRRSSVRRPGSVLMPTVFSTGKDDHLGPVPENDVSPVAGDNRQSYMSFDSRDSVREPMVTITDTSEPSAAGFLGTRDSMISTVSTEMDMNSSVIDRFDEDDEDEYDDEEEEEISDENPKWMRGKLIGSGSFGNVYLGLNALTGELMAVKQVEMPTGSGEDSRKQSMIDALTREIALLKDLQHPNIVQYLASNKEDNCFNIFLEYVPGGSVAGMLNNYGPLREPLIRTFVKQILHGLAYLHGKNIIHRDIKGANVLVDNKGGIKISDFGISKKMEADLLTFSNGAHRPSLQGSVFWMAPEVVKQTSYTLKADIWSLGCLIVEMFTGSHPYPDCSQLQAIFKIGTGGSAPKIPPQSTEEGKVFLGQTFELDHNKRPTADELLLSPFLLPLVGGAAAAETELKKRLDA